MVRALLVCAVLCGACSDTGTTLLIDLRVAGADSAPASVKLTLFDRERALLLDRVVQTPSLPGTLLLRGLPAVDQPVRVAVEAQSGAARLLGGDTAMLRAGQQAQVLLVLSSTTADRDGDGIADAIDNCADHANHDQSNSDGSGGGDACPGVSTDASVADASFDLSNDASLDAGGASLCPGTFALCESFESGAIGAPRWQVYLDNGSYAIETGQAYRGTQSIVLRTMTADMGGSMSEIKTDAIFPQLATHLFARTWFRLSPGTSYVRVLVSVGSGQGYVLYAATDRIGVDNYGVAPSSSEHFVPIPVGSWQCLEWELTGGIGNGASRVWLNDVEMTGVTRTGLEVPNMTQILLGIEAVNPTALETRLDEIVLDGQRVGCAR
jgi:hypothetical protein